jgi:membrane protein required for colicin V production
MNLVDLAVLIVIALSAVFAFARGFVREALSVVAWIGAALVTFYGFDWAHGLTARFVATPLLAELIAGAGLFLISLIVLTMLTGYAAGFMQWSALTPIDRTLGLAFGVVRGVLLVSIAYFLVDMVLPQNERPTLLRDARSAPLLAQGASMVRGVLPPSLQLKTTTVSEDTQRTLSQAREAHEAMGALATPAVPIPPKPQDAPPPNYKPTDQRGMDQLIGTVQQPPSTFSGRSR